MPGIDIFPLTPDRWLLFEALFGPRGACAGCWCMYWKLSRREFEAARGEPNRLVQKAFVGSGQVPGLLACVDGVPAGWIALEPRAAYPTLARSRLFKPLDDLSVWSVTCFFVHKDYRRQGLTVRLLQAALEHARLAGAPAVEGYPVDPLGDAKMPPVFVYTGLLPAFQQAGFREVARPSPSRPVMRFVFEESQ